MRFTIFTTAIYTLLLSTLVFLSPGQCWGQGPDLTKRLTGPRAVILGIAQDAGYPQAGCRKECCRDAWTDRKLRRMPTCLGLLNPRSGRRWMLDCTWQFPDQHFQLEKALPANSGKLVDGIFLTHAHIGHYTGLMHLGREAIGADAIPVHAMPRMRQFLQDNGPWNLLLKLNHIQLKPMEAGLKISLDEELDIEPIEVPHRGEFTETVAFLVKGPNKSLLYLPDIDKWSKWETRIESILEKVDFALLDATFFANGEIPGRDMSQIPHPFVEESLIRFQHLSKSTRNKIHFIHLNHTNPAIRANSEARRQIIRAGMHVAEEGQSFPL